MAAGSHCFVSLAVVAGPQCLLITPRRISALPYRRERCLLATAALSSSAAPTLPGFLKVVRGRESFEGPSVNLVLVSFSLPVHPESTRVVSLLSLHPNVLPIMHSSAVASVKKNSKLLICCSAS